MDTLAASTSSKLADDELEEYQKVFSIICTGKLSENDEIENIQHLNEHSFFTSSNVTAFVQKMSHNFTIWKQHVSPIMTMLDVKYSGMISWDVFTTAISDWIRNSLSFEGLCRRRTGLIFGWGERQVLHYLIANFFLLTAKDVGHSVLKLNFALQVSGSKSDFRLIDLSNVDKATTYKDPSELMQNFDMISRELLLIENYSQRIAHINIMLAFVSKIETPLDLYLHSELLKKIFDMLFSSGICDQIIKSIVQDTQPATIWESLKLLSVITACLRIRNKQFDGPSYIETDQTKNYILNPEFLAVLLRLATDPCVEIREQSLVCLGFIAQASEASRAYFISSQAVQNFTTNYLVIENDERHLELIGFFLSSIATSLRSDINYIYNTNLLYILADAGFKLLSLKDSYGLLKSGCEILDVALPFVNLTSENRSVLERLINLISLHVNSLVKKIVLSTVLEIAEHNDAQIKMLMDMNLIQILLTIISSNEHTLKLHCFKIIHVISKKGHILQLFESKALAVIMKSLYDTPHCRWECIKIIKAIALHSNTYISLLVELGVIKGIFENLNGFQEQDEILTEVYNFQGAYLNLPYFMDSVTTLNAILTAGNMSKSGGSLNMFADHYDRECVERFQTAVMALFDSKNELKSQIKRTYTKRYSEIGFEQLIITLLINIKNAHKNKESDTSKFVNSQVSSLIYVVNSKFQELNSYKSSPDKDKEIMLEVKCFSANEFPHGDNRIFTISRAATFDEFKNAIEHKYGYYGPFMITYFNKNNDPTLITDSKIYEKVMSDAIENLLTLGVGGSQGSMRLLIQFDVAKEVQCYECGKIFEVFALYESIDPDEIFVCKACKDEQSQISWTGLPNMSVSQHFAGTPYGYKYR